MDPVRYQFTCLVCEFVWVWELKYPPILIDCPDCNSSHVEIRETAYIRRTMENGKVLWVGQLHPEDPKSTALSMLVWDPEAHDNPTWPEREDCPDWPWAYTYGLYCRTEP